MSANMNFIVKIVDKRSASTTEVTAANATWTVEQLKKAYANVRKSVDIGGDWTNYTFYKGSTALGDGDLLSAHAIANGTTLQALYEEPKIRVQVRGLDGRTTKIDTYASWTVRRLKEEYARWLGQGWDNVVLLYKAKRLRDEDLLSVYKVEGDGFIQANIRTTGGQGQGLKIKINRGG